MKGGREKLVWATQGGRMSIWYYTNNQGQTIRANLFGVFSRQQALRALTDAMGHAPKAYWSASGRW